MGGTLNITTVIDGVEHTQDDVRGWELNHARSALALLKDRIGDESMRELLAEDLRVADGAMASFLASSGGAWRSAVTEMEADGIAAEDFVAWWQGRLTAGDRAALLAANPEHYLADSSGGVVEIIETIGSGPLRFFLAFQERVDLRGEGQEGRDAYPIRIGAVGRLPDGAEAIRVLHEFGDRPHGMRIRLTVQFPATTPRHVFVGHQWHFACEFLNWLEAANAAVKAQGPVVRDRAGERSPAS